MAVNWTPKQMQVIEARNRNLLVSAAAGSGKTAVLVERIIRMVTDKDNPIDIDRLLVMTFTNAAAAEMRERVAVAIEKQLADNPDDEHLQIQSALVQYAQITTIDSFCLKLIREHFNSLDIDPGFRIGDDGELMLLKADVMKQMLEEYYEADNQEFEQFVETYAVGKGDGGIEDYIMQVYTFSQSNPFPKEWYETCKKELEEGSLEDMQDTAWLKFMMQDISLQAAELIRQTHVAMETCEDADGPAPYLPMLNQDKGILEQLAAAGDYETLSNALRGVTFAKLAPVRSKDIDPQKKAYVGSCRDRVKKAIGKLRDQYCFTTAEEAFADMEKTRPAVRMLLSLAADFADRYQESKKEKNIVDFNDLEHYALKVLTRMEEGVLSFTSVADELGMQFEEILVDEYQDSNQVQETLIQSLSRERFGKPNVFMVGDVKQSIYKFRLARPELFLEKYETYTQEESLYQKIELHQNFRSRETVLTSINDVFYRIMTKNLGNIEYTKDAALHPGAEFKENQGNVNQPTELLMVNTNGDLLRQLDEDSADYTSRELEAKLIAKKIREMTDPKTGLLIWDKEKEAYRTACYRDMTILLRSFAGWTEVFLNVLMNEGIPAYAESKTGYFNTIEVETVLSILSIIDNPMQDIPLAAVMKSPVASISDGELAALIAVFKKTADKKQDRGLYGAWKYYLNLPDPPDKDLYDKLKQFEELIQTFRYQSTYLTIHEVIYQVFSQTGYYDYVSAMPAGDTRKANLDMLAQKAADYEKTSYKGLFHFIRYIDKLRKFDTDFGEASTVGEHDDTVRIMSIHKSKGLEFPIVFLAGMGKNFNKRDVYSKILIDSELGIGTDYLDLDLRLKAHTLKKNVLKRKMELDGLGEELRVFYVAMTRAKEKLIMTATDRYLENKLEKWNQIPLIGNQVPFTILSSAGSYLDWILMSLSDSGGKVQVTEVPVSDLVGQEMVRQVKKKASKDSLLQFDQEEEYDLEYREELCRSFSYQYPFQEDIKLHTKMSVSEMKVQGQGIDNEESAFLPTIPAFLQGEEESEEGAYRGTAYHRALELLPFARIHSAQDIKMTLDALVDSGKLAKESARLADCEVLWKFVTSPLGRRMSLAEQEGRLHKEQQFTLGIPARDMGVCDSDELVVIQGILDAYMEEDGQLVLVDYKTDRIRKGQESKLLLRYSEQLNYYQKALEQITKKKVKEKLIYSLALHKTVEIEEENKNAEEDII